MSNKLSPMVEANGVNLFCKGVFEIIGLFVGLLLNLGLCFAVRGTNCIPDLLYYKYVSH